MTTREPDRGTGCSKGARIWPPPAFDVMAKPTGARCNLTCTYCYYRDQVDRVPGASLKMTEQVLESFVRQYIDAQRVPEVEFGWQGGEPAMMGIHFYELAVELQRRFAPTGMRVHNFFQTNGTLLDEQWGAFFKKHGFVVGVSLDGPPDLHDIFRTDGQGRGSSDRVLAGLEILVRQQVELNVLACVHSANVHRPLDVYRFLRDEVGARFIQFIPVVERQQSDVDQVSVTEETVEPAAFARFLISIFEEWVRRDVGEVFVQLFDVMLAAWVGARPGLCAFASTCGAALVLEHDGDLYACDHFVTPEHRLGNILETPLLELVGSERQRSFSLEKRTGLPKSCLGCNYLSACRGDCPKHRLRLGSVTGPPRSFLCESYHVFLTHVAPYLDFMARQIAQRRSPARIMAALKDAAR